MFVTADWIMGLLACEPYISLVDTHSLLFTNIITKMMFQKNAVDGASAAQRGSFHVSLEKLFISVALSRALVIKHLL